jgi:hypothetical protein
MALITTGAHPLALQGSAQKVAEQSPQNVPLRAVAGRFVGSGKKPPHIKRAFGASTYGKAFNKD